MCPELEVPGCTRREGVPAVMVIDTTFDFRTDAAGKDPDTYSATLCRYHQLLWSKPLPSGVVFELCRPAVPVLLQP